MMATFAPARRYFFRLTSHSAGLSKSWNARTTTTSSRSRGEPGIVDITDDGLDVGEAVALRVPLQLGERPAADVVGVDRPSGADALRERQREIAVAGPCRLMAVSGAQAGRRTALLLRRDPANASYRLATPPSRLAALERIENRHTRLLEVRRIPSDDRQSVHEGRGRDETVLDRHGTPCRAKRYQQRGPSEPGVHVPRETLEPFNT